MGKLADSLYQMVEMQKRLMIALGVIDPQSLSKTLLPSMASKYAEAATGIVCEAAEVLEIVTKMNRPWKAHIDAKAEERFAHLKEELIDVLFYTLEMLIHMGLDEDDIFEQFKKKQIIVNSRILKGYEPREIVDSCSSGEGIPALAWANIAVIDEVIAEGIRISIVNSCPKGVQDGEG